jgi:uncharacterized protein (TIGR04551 family)
MTLRVAIAPGRSITLARHWAPGPAPGFAGFGRRGALGLGLALVLALASGGPREARAQVSPNPLPPTGNEPATTTKKPGVAERAEVSAETLPTTPVLPPIQNERKRFELFELDGYFRLRTNWFKNFHLGYNDNPAVGGAPFPRPLSCADEGGCGEDTLQSVDMRLRLEPTINIGETAQVHLQLDALDNVVLGSTPVTRAGAGAGTGVPSGFDDNQAPPEAGFNHYADSIRVKRAWAEVETSLGQLTFGRQPWHWGLGIYANAGGNDPFSDTYDLHDDFGDTVDRVMFRARVPGTRIDAALAMDWAATGPTASQSGLYLDANPQEGRIGGRPLDLDDADDVSQWTFMLTRFDAPELFRESVERGDLAFNYGAFLVYRTQENELVPGTGTEAGTLRLVPRGLTTYTPDVWFRVGLGKLLVEGEAVLTIGGVDNVSDLEPARTEDVEILRFGGVARATYRALDGTMRLGIEGGVASGDVADTDPAGSMHVSNLRVLDPINGKSLGTFLFDQDYDIDLILFREMIGAVTNAFYVRPTVTYEVSDDIDATISGVISGALRPDGTPGDSRMYGVELDATIGYRSGGFFLGFAGGALFAFSALDHVGSDFNAVDPDGEGPQPPTVADNHDTDGNAYTIQSRLVLEF